MNKIFPQAMIDAAKYGKMCFLSDPQPKNPNDCANCGGWGFFVLFIATNGPFQSPTAHKVSKYYNNGWWVGESNTFKCPVCGDGGGMKNKPAAAQRPSQYSQRAMIEDRPSAIDWDDVVDQVVEEIE